MNEMMKIVKWGAVLFSVMCVIEALFWPSSIAFYPDNYLFPFGLIFLGYVFAAHKESRVFIAFFGLMFFTGLVSDLMAHKELRPESIGYLLRWLKWAAIFSGFAYGLKDLMRREQLDLAVKAAFMALAIINVLILVNIGGTGESIQYLFTPKSDFLISNFNEVGGFRLAGTFMNPNDNAAVFGLFFLYFLSDGIRKNWQFLIIAFVLVLLTQSRTVFMALVVISLMEYIMSYKANRGSIWIPISVLLVSAAFLLVFNASNLVSIVTGEAFVSNSWMTRLDNLRLFSDIPMSNRIFGHGVLNDPYASLGVFIDSEYLAILFQYGIIGFLIWLSGIFYAIIGIGRKPENKWFWITAFILVLVISFTNYALLNQVVAIALMSLLGLYAFAAKNKIDNTTANKTK
jgi:hypothetical protein